MVQTHIGGEGGTYEEEIFPSTYDYDLNLSMQPFVKENTGWDPPATVSDEFHTTIGMGACHLTGATLAQRLSGGSVATGGNPTTAFKRQIYTEREWDQIRPALETRYLTPGVTLSDAMREMSLNHNFHATIAMYKKHLNKWDISKYMKADKKDAIISEFGNDVTSASTEHRDKVVLQKTLRHAKILRKNGKLPTVPCDRLKERISSIQKSAKHDQNVVPKSAFSSTSPVRLSGLSPKTPLPASTIYFPVEKLLHATRSSVMFMLTDTINPTSAEQRRISALCECIRIGYDFLKARAYTKARREFCDLDRAIEQDLRNKNPEFIPSIVQILVQWPWTSPEDLSQWRQVVAKYLHRAVCRRLGREHVLTLFLGLFSELFVVSAKENTVAVCRCILDSMVSCRVDTSSELFLIVQHTTTIALRRANRLQEATIVCQKLLEDLSTVRRHHRMDILYSLGEVQLDQGLVEASVSTFEELRKVAKSMSNYGFEFDACSEIATALWTMKGDTLQAERWFRECLLLRSDVSCSRPGKVAQCFQQALEMLEQCEASERTRQFVHDFTDLYHWYLETVDDRARWRTGKPCSLGRSICICQVDLIPEIGAEC